MVNPMITPNDWRAERSLRAIRALAESILAGKVRLTEAYVFVPEQHLYNWWSVLSIIWSHTYEGLGEDIPTPPPMPTQPSYACQGFRPCPNCPLVNRINDDDTEKRGSE